MHKKIDILNIGLIGISLAIAFILPFKLFLFSYAFLGPLHYLTEINWLKEKQYFLKADSKWIRIFIIFTVLLTIYPIYRIIDLGLSTSFEEAIKYIFGKQKIIVLTAFFFAIGLILFRKLKHLLLTLGFSFLLAILLFLYLPKWLFVLGLFLPTIIHVYLFTLLFMLYGSKKSKSVMGYVGSGLLLIVPLIIAFVTIDPGSYVVSKETATIYDTSRLMRVNLVMTQMFGGLIDGKFYILSTMGIKIQVFIAFAYTYHYLNWFSKTSIIGWKKSLTTRRTIYILIIWAAAIGIYMYDFYTGLMALYFLSLLHVFFEFPLNVITIKELFNFKIRKVKA
ncbi:MAG: hypothetical protein AAF489_04995 [Bacteroidota bacterium]